MPQGPRRSASGLTDGENPGNCCSDRRSDDKFKQRQTKHPNEVQLWDVLYRRKQETLNTFSCRCEILICYTLNL